MTLEEIRKVNPEAAQAYLYAVERRLGSKKAAERLKISLPCLKGRLRRARQLLGGLAHRTNREHQSPDDVARIEAKLTRYGRCKRCQLLWPCVCLPKSAAEIAGARTGHGATYPGSPL